MDRRTERVLLLLLLSSIILLLYRRNQSALPRLSSPNSRIAHFTAGKIEDKPLILQGLEPANSTLGFGAVAAVSKEGSRRRPGLLLAANITEIDVTIPEQPQWTDEDVETIYAERDSWLTRGSALAWLGHLNTLRWFLSTDLETILIFEDDVDWDIHLRTSQIPAAAAAVRKLTSDYSDPKSNIEYNPRIGNYWGNTSEWDLLYLGHCGDIFRPQRWDARVPRVTYKDETLLPFPQLHPYTAKFLETIKIPSGTRIVHKSIFPLCTFGFALTRNAASRLLYEIAYKEPDGGKMAYDVRVLEACRDFGFRCWSVNPELFHHMESKSEIEMVDDEDFGVPKQLEEEEEEAENASGGATGTDLTRLKPIRGGVTPNIACAIRSKYFWTQDADTLDFLREEVGRKGMCLKDVMEEDVARVAEADPDRFDWPDDWQDPRLGDISIPEPAPPPPPS